MKITSKDYPSVPPVNQLDSMEPGKSYIVKQRITSGPNEPTVIHTTIKKVTNGKIKVRFRKNKP